MWPRMSHFCVFLIFCGLVCAGLALDSFDAPCRFQQFDFIGFLTQRNIQSDVSLESAFLPASFRPMAYYISANDSLNGQEFSPLFVFQKANLTTQIDYGVRYISVELNYGDSPDEPVACYAGVNMQTFCRDSEECSCEDPASCGCSNAPTLANILSIVQSALSKYPVDVFVLDLSTSTADESSMFDMISSVLSSHAVSSNIFTVADYQVHTSQAQYSESIAWPTLAELTALGKRLVVLASNTSLAGSSTSPVHFLSSNWATPLTTAKAGPHRMDSFEGVPSCSVDTARDTLFLPPYFNSLWGRFYFDTADVLNITTGQAVAACGYSPSTFSLDEVRIASNVWTWAIDDDEPVGPGRCAYAAPTSPATSPATVRWHASPICNGSDPSGLETPLRYTACRADGMAVPLTADKALDLSRASTFWTFSSSAVAWTAGASACGTGYSFLPPLTPLENALLGPALEAAGLAAAWLNLQDFAQYRNFVVTDLAADFAALEAAKVAIPSTYIDRLGGAQDCNLRCFDDDLFLPAAQCCLDVYCYGHGLCHKEEGKAVCDCVSGFFGESCTLLESDQRPAFLHETVDNPIQAITDNVDLVVYAFTSVGSVAVAVGVVFCVLMRARQQSQSKDKWL